MVEASLEALLAILTVALGIIVALTILLFHYVQREKHKRLMKLEAFLSEVRREAEKFRFNISRLEEAFKVLEGEVLPAVRALNFQEALERLGKVGVEEASKVDCELKAYRSLLESLRALKEACRDAVRIWVLEAVRVHLPQTMKRWKAEKHGFNPLLDELLSRSLASGIFEVRNGSLYEWFKLNHPGLFEALSKLVDPSESLEVFFRMLEKTLSGLDYLKVFQAKLEEASSAERLKAALEVERQKLLERLEGLGGRLTEAKA